MTMLDSLKSDVIQNLKTLIKTKELVSGVNSIYYDSRDVSKSAKQAEKAKEAGNELFLSGKHDFRIHHRILCNYNESIAYAPIESEELAAAYGNKSALLKSLRKYKYSICEADKALKVTKFVALKVKLLCRKAECYTALGSSENRSCLEKARFLMSKFEGAEKLEITLNDWISKTQRAVDEGKLDIPKEARRKMQGIKLVSDAEKLNVWNSVSIEYSERYGKHLVAARDFKSGEMILVEKPYFNIVPDEKAFVYCYHCFKYLWTAVPCDQCSWRLFCSTECKVQASHEYHDMECSAVLNMKKTVAFGQYTHVPVIVSLFFKALKEAGGDVHQLQTNLELIDKYKDENMIEFFGDEEIANYKNIFSLPTRNLEKYDFDACLKSAVIALAGLARFTKLFDTSYDYTEIKKLMKNDLAVFVGALLAKYAIIITSRCAQINLFDPDEKSDEMNSGLGTLFPRRENSSPLNSLSVLGQFTILNCIPNVMKTYTHNNKFIAFALHPIKKGEKLTSSVACMYQRTPKLVRQAKYQKLYNRPCDCQACTENWFETPGSDGSQGIPVSESDLPTAREILDETHAVFYDWDKKGSKLNHPDIKLLTRASNVVEKAWVHFPPPSPFSVNALIQLMKLSFDFYQPAEEYSEFSEP